MECFSFEGFLSNLYPCPFDFVDEDSTALELFGRKTNRFNSRHGLVGGAVPKQMLERLEWITECRRDNTYVNIRVLCRSAFRMGSVDIDTADR